MKYVVQRNYDRDLSARVNENINNIPVTVFRAPQNAQAAQLPFTSNFSLAAGFAWMEDQVYCSNLSPFEQY
jgi:hypothetical protein